MAKCYHCKQEMRDAATVTCTANRIVGYDDGEYLPSVAYDATEGATGEGRCHDCNIADGGKHHPGCDMEVCPRCGGQLISCECGLEGEDEDDE